ncbi:4'-phosphopantetheinyl transferase superfamily protein [Ancylomarina sp. 16SWW S1-10-2]|uniref:4'-phosphopantetheinyl transferase family protein n=1 Tax=Ancylomarina sp. 16SWW S1-10-2 TaxID=2499681 RepID=UPI0012AE54EE|nr:4'-phosphopantetheinyl transferase superfamily protein [Ancylomarina sp. 16SWW S1-10-2]MRT91449.1 4'-phosphopantetheinyl transferase superfamily protein [Ancylomarina sp. 16SWW S1-10-2]
MPLVKNIQLNESCQMALWKISEELDELLVCVSLNKEDRIKLDSFGSLSRKKEFIATRILVQELLGKGITIVNNEHGKPLLVNSNYEISISHSKEYVGVMVGLDHDMALDIEYLSDRVYRICNRFLSKDELSFISEADKQLHIYQHWCAKECLIKLYGKKDALLIDELKIFPFKPSQSVFSGEFIRKNYSKKFNFQHQTFDSYLMVWCCQKRT